jgi:hypothetical protein
MSEEEGEEDSNNGPSSNGLLGSADNAAPLVAVVAGEDLEM